MKVISVEVFRDFSQEEKGDLSDKFVKAIDEERTAKNEKKKILGLLEEGGMDGEHRVYRDDDGVYYFEDTGEEIPEEYVTYAVKDEFDNPSLFSEEEEAVNKREAVITPAPQERLSLPEGDPEGDIVDAEYEDETEYEEEDLPVEPICESDLIPESEQLIPDSVPNF